MTDTDAAVQPVVEASNDAKMILSRDQLDDYFRYFNNPDASAEYLAKALNIQDYLFDARSSIKLDFCTYALEFSMNVGFGLQRTASMVNLAMNVLDVCIAGGSFQKAQASLRSQLLKLTLPQPTEDDAYLSPDHVAKVATFLAQTFFRHYTLYSYVFSNLQEHMHYSAELLVEEPGILSFEDALTQAEFEAYEAVLVAEAEAARQAAEEAEWARIEAGQQAMQAALEQEALEKRKAKLEKRPVTLEEAIEHAVACCMEDEKTRLASVYKLKEEVYLAKISELQAQLAAAKNLS